MFQDAWVQIISQPMVADFLVLFAAIGIYLIVLARGLHPPADDRVRGAGIVVAGLSMGNIGLAIILSINLHFQLLEMPFPQYGPTRAAASRKESGQHKLTSKKPKSDIDSQKGAEKRASGKPDFPEGSWETVKVWAGHSFKKTETFYIPAQAWVIDWITASTNAPPGNFQVMVYDASTGNFLSHAKNARNPDQEGIILTGPGKYYLVIDTSQQYRVTASIKKGQR